MVVRGIMLCGCSEGVDVATMTLRQCAAGSYDGSMVSLVVYTPVTAGDVV